MPAPPAKKSNVGLIVGIVVGAVLLLCVGGTVGVVALLRSAASEVGDALSSVTIPVESPIDESTDGPDPGPTGETFDMAIGEGVEVTEPDGDQWTVYVLDAVWFNEPCDSFGAADYPILVVDVEFEVTSGTASLFTITDFAYVDEDGELADMSFLTFCDDPALTDTIDRSEGDLVTGKIAFEVPEGKAGRLVYSSEFERTASWLVPAQT